MSVSILHSTDRAPETLAELLGRRAEQHPDQLAYVFLTDGEREEASRTYGELDRQARAIAARLRTVVQPGDRVLLLHPPGLEFVAALFGCFHAGVLAVPAPPPKAHRGKDRLLALAADAGARWALTTSDALARIDRSEAKPPEVEGLRWLASDTIPLAEAEAWSGPPAGGGDIAYLQYTSGSTSRPRGVAVSHENVLQNVADIWNISMPDDGNQAVSWLPLFHDMGLVYGIFQPLFFGFPCALMAPSAFLQQPIRWLRAISRYRATQSAAPNFAYDLCVHRTTPADREGLELSCWTTAVNGAEPVHAGTLERFRDAFAPHGFRLSSFAPGYGLAEATLVVTGVRNGREPRFLAVQAEAWARGRVVVSLSPGPSVRTLVGCGVPVLTTRLLIVDPETRRRCASDEVGEVWLESPCVARGYWNRPEETEQAFGAHLAGSGEGPFLRTGDLGFVHDGELFVTGRVKDLIILRGRNLYPHDIERTAEACHPALRQSSGAAFAVEVHDEERLVLAQEVRREDRRGDLDGMAAAIRRAVAEEHEVQVYAVAFLLAGSLPKTSSGKVQRSLCRKLFLEGGLRLLGSSVLEDSGRSPQGPEVSRERLLAVPLEERAGLLEQFLAARAARWLGIGLADLDLRQPLLSYGLDSLSSLELQSDVESRLGVLLPLSCFLEPEAGVAAIAAEILARWSSAPAGGLPVLVPSPEDRHQPFPLTDMQQAYWIGRTGAVDAARLSAHVYAELELDGGEAELERLERAWRGLLERHDMLRAVVLPDGRQQVLEQVPPYRIAAEDLRGQGRVAVEARLAAVRRELSHQVLPADRWPLFEVRASLLAGPRLRLHLSLDGLLADGWSYRLLFREWFELYRRPEPALAPLEVSFRDYVLAQAGLEGSEAYRRSEEYWQARLPLLPPAPRLPLARSLASLPEPRFTRRAAQRPLEPLRRGASQVGLTLPAALLAAYAETLAIWSRSPRFTLNVPRFNRLPLHPQVDRLVGEFASFTLLAVDGSGDDSLASRARRLQRQLWQDLEHGRVSGVRLVRELARLQESGATAAMPVVFTSLLFPQPPSEAAEDPVPPQVYGVTQTPQVWMDLQVSERAGDLFVHLDAIEELFPRGFLDDLFGAFLRLLDYLADSPESWSDGPRRLLAPVRPEPVASLGLALPPPAGLAHDRFTAQATRSPERVAVLSDRRTLTYGELDALSNRLGRRLRQGGARPDALVAVVMEKGWEQSVAVLGTLKSGAAYLPIDPEVPAERLAYLLENGEVRLALTQPWLDERLAWPAGVERLAVTDGALAGCGGEPLEPAQSPDDLVYVIYTSGSTGSPKGVMVAHRGVVNALEATNRRFAVGPDDRVLALTALHHDMSVYDLFGLLAVGGALVLPEPERRRDPGHWLELMARHGVTVWNSVPAMMEMLAEYAEAQAAALPASLRLAFLGGDWIPLSLPRRLAERARDLKVVSVGGPTETTLWNIWYPVERLDPAWKSVPYGRPIERNRYYVLNEDLEECPVWVPGELCCAGVGLARGYWRDPARTRERFVTHPRTGERLYRTGDIGRWLPDGALEFLGREDFQVQIRGHRVELGEIESALASHPAVGTALVAAQGDEKGARRLVAYVVRARETGGAGAEGQPEGYDPAQREPGAVPTNRLEFKLRQRGVRRDAGGERIALPRPELDEAALRARIARCTHRTFLDRPVPFADLGALLSSFGQIELDGWPFPKYRYPSGGGLYPVQTYLHVKPGRVEGLAGGAYYYHPREHALVALSGPGEIDREVHVPTNREIFDEAAFSLFLIADLDAIAPLYGDLSRDFCLLEAGFMGQLLMQEAASSGIGLCPVGSLDFAPIRHQFALAESHILAHSLLGGAVDPSRVTGWSMRPEEPGRRPAAPAAGDEALSRELSELLKSKLPGHMVPSAFVFLEALPLTAAGKVDRKSLPDPGALRPVSGAAYAAPGTEIELAIAAVWQDQIGIERVGVHDHFFELGADSVQVVKAHGEICRRLGRSFPLVAMFQYPSIAGLAAHLAAGGDGDRAFNEQRDRAGRRSESMEREKQLRLQRRRERGWQGD